MDLVLVTAEGRRYALDPGINVVGRSLESDIVLEDGSMSRRHAELHWDGQQCQVVDLGSTNGTYVDGQRLPPHQPHPVRPGAQLSFGPTMTVALAEAGAAAARPAPPPARPAPAPGERGGGLALLFRALDVALDYRKLALGFLGLLAAGIVTVIFLWLGGQLAGESAFLGIVIGVLGVAALLVVLTYLNGAITRLAFLELAEGRRAGIREALGYAGRHLLGFLLSPLALVAGLVLVLVAEAILLLIGRIDYVGELVVSLLFLPLVLVNLVTFVMAWFGTALSFPIVADRGGGVRDTISRVWSIVRRLPGRLVAYMTVAGLISLFMFLFCFYLVAAALYATLSLTAVGMEPLKFMFVFSGLPLDVGDLLPELPFGGLGFSPGELPATFAIARVLFGLSVAGLMTLVLVIPQLFFLASTCAVYLNLRQDLPGAGGSSPRAETWAASEDSGPGTKTCRHCGAPLAYDQVYCPNCGQLQR